MGILSWFRGGKLKKPPTADLAAYALSEAVLLWCSPEHVAELRTELQIPADAHSFDVELFYLYVFLALTSIETSYGDDLPLTLGITRSFVRNIGAAIAAGDRTPFCASIVTMKKRHLQYVRLRERDIDEMLEGLPLMFLDSCGVCYSQLHYDLVRLETPLRYLEAWLGIMLKELAAFNKRWRQQHDV